MAPDYRDLPAITDRSFDVSFYPTVHSKGSSAGVFEGRTECLSRCHLRAFVDDVGSPPGAPNASPEDYWPGRDVRMTFHTIASVLDEVTGEVVLVQPADDRRYRWLIEVAFRREINLFELRL